VIAVMGLTYLGARAPTLNQAAPAPGATAPGLREFQAQGCGGCHMIGGVGGTSGPDLSHVGARMTRAEIEGAILQGSGRMPAFPYMPEDELKALTEYLASAK